MFGVLITDARRRILNAIQSAVDDAFFDGQWTGVGPYRVGPIIESGERVRVQVTSAQQIPPVVTGDRFSVQKWLEEQLAKAVPAFSTPADAAAIAGVI